MHLTRFEGSRPPPLEGLSTWPADTVATAGVGTYARSSDGRAVVSKTMCPRFKSGRVCQRSGTIPVSRKARSHRLVGRSAAVHTLTRLSAQAPTVGDETAHRIRNAAKATVGWLRQAVNLELRSRGFNSLSRYTHPGWCDAGRCRSANPIAAKASPTKPRQGTSGITPRHCRGGANLGRGSPLTGVAPFLALILGGRSWQTLVWASLKSTGK